MKRICKRIVSMIGFVLFILGLMCIILFASGCSDKDFDMVDEGREKAIEAMITNQPGGDTIPELYLDVAYELSRLAATDWEVKGKPSGYSFEWTYLDSSQSILRATSIALKVTYSDGHECVYSTLIYR